MAASTASRSRVSATDALSDVLAESWWAVGIRGILAIVFGLICLLATNIALPTLILLFGIYMLVDGVFAIASGIKAARNGERWGLLTLEGVVDIAVGVIALTWPIVTLVALMWIIGFWAVITGALMLVSSFTLKIDHGRWWLALGGIASLVFGIVLLIAPLVGAAVLTWWLGAYALVFGVLLLILAFQLHSRQEKRGRSAGRAKKRA